MIKQLKSQAGRRAGKRLNYAKKQKGTRLKRYVSLLNPKKQGLLDWHVFIHGWFVSVRRTC